MNEEIVFKVMMTSDFLLVLSWVVIAKTEFEDYSEVGVSMILGVWVASAVTAIASMIAYIWI